MGTKVAPTYATLVLGYLEEKMYCQIKHKKDENFANYLQTNWKRFLDDCFIFWERSIAEFLYFENTLNSLHKDIKFKMNESSDKLPFLDIMIIKQGTSINTDIYFKSTDSKQYLTFRSCHPKHTKTNIPFSLARRVCTIVSERNRLKIRLKELAKALLNRKYPLEIIKTGIKKAIKIPRNKLLHVEQKPKTNITPYVSTHNPKNRELFGIINTNMDILKEDETMKKIINETKFIKCKRQLPNLKRILTKSEFKEINKTASVSKCKEPRCALCDYLVEGNTLEIKGRTFYVKENMDCKVKNVMYVLRCNGCSEFYIGQTGDKLRNRRTVHDQQIRDPSTRQLPVSAHIDNCSKGHPKYSIFPFYKFHTDDVSARLPKERYFIDKYSPKLNAN